MKNKKDKKRCMYTDEARNMLLSTHWHHQLHFLNISQEFFFLSFSLLTPFSLSFSTLACTPIVGGNFSFLMCVPVKQDRKKNGKNMKKNKKQYVCTVCY